MCTGYVPTKRRGLARESGHDRDNGAVREAVDEEGGDKVTTATLWIPALILGLLMLIFLIYYISS